MQEGCWSLQTGLASVYITHPIRLHLSMIHICTFRRHLHVIRIVLDLILQSMNWPCLRGQNTLNKFRRRKPPESHLWYKRYITAPVSVCV